VTLDEKQDFGVGKEIKETGVSHQSISEVVGGVAEGNQEAWIGERPIEDWNIRY
jgi:hypothetical protein